MLRKLRSQIYNRKLGWEFIGATTEGVPLADWELDYWSLSGQRSGEGLTLKEPLYFEDKSVSIHEAKVGDHNIRYAFGEFTNGVYGFYVPV